MQFRKFPVESAQPSKIWTNSLYDLTDPRTLFYRNTSLYSNWFDPMLPSVCWTINISLIIAEGTNYRCLWDSRLGGTRKYYGPKLRYFWAGIQKFKCAQITDFRGGMGLQKLRPLWNGSVPKGTYGTNFTTYIVKHLFSDDSLLFAHLNTGRSMCVARICTKGRMAGSLHTKQLLFLPQSLKITLFVAWK
jgi:hypothetical protein